jgi:hypothetical protein
MRQETFQNTGTESAVTTLQLNSILDALQQHARTCATAGEDSSQEALTGESSNKEKNTQDARIWQIKSEVWLEAEAVVRGITISLDQRVARK